MSGSVVKNASANAGDEVDRPLGWEDPEKEMTTHSNPCLENPVHKGAWQATVVWSCRVGHDLRAGQRITRVQNKRMKVTIAKNCNPSVSPYLAHGHLRAGEFLYICIYIYIYIHISFSPPPL